MQSAASLILITIDCLRADHSGFLGYQRPTTPFLDSLAEQSLVFTNVTAAGAPTYYSLPSLLASRFPLELGRDVVGLAPEETTIATVLGEAGFNTAAFIAANPYISPRFGCDAGFTVFKDFLDTDGFDSSEYENHSENAFRSRVNRQLATLCHAAEPFGRVYDELYFRYCQKLNASVDQTLDSLRKFPSADIIVDHATSWLAENGRRPFFLWLHFMDPHAPYFPKKRALELMGGQEVDAAGAQFLNSYWARGDLDARRLRNKRDEVIKLYDAGIRWADEQIRRLFEVLVDLNMWSGCTLAVTADHGEEFLDHGRRFHAPAKLNQELIHVPLLVRTPDQQRPKTIEKPVSLIDLAPTLLDAMNLPIPSDFRGRSCWKELSNGQLKQREIISESVRGCTNPFRVESRYAPRILAVRRDKYKLLVDFAAGEEELFDLAADPGEQVPLRSDVCTTIRRELLEHARRHLANSRSSCDLEKRMATQLREIRLEWMQPTVGVPN